MAPRESRTLEFKEKVTNTFLKTVSAYANYGDGRILFETKDDGTIAGIENPKAACLFLWFTERIFCPASPLS